MYKQEPYLSEYIDVRAGVYFKPFYNVLADCGVRKLKSSLTDMRETYSENIYADFTQYLAEQLQEICMRTLIVSLQAINKVALLFMAVFLTGMIAIYQLRFEHREESYGISLAYGAQYKELYWEIFCEILLLNSIGTIIGIVIGYLVTYYVDFGIMISVVNVQGSWYTFLSAYGLCVVLSSFVSVITFRKLKKKKIIELLNVY